MLTRGRVSIGRWTSSLACCSTLASKVKVLNNEQTINNSVGSVAAWTVLQCGRCPTQQYQQHKGMVEMGNPGSDNSMARRVGYVGSTELAHNGGGGVHGGIGAYIFGDGWLSFGVPLYGSHIYT